MKVTALRLAETQTTTLYYKHLSINNTCTCGIVYIFTLWDSDCLKHNLPLLKKNTMLIRKLVYLLNYCSKCGRSRCHLNHIDEIYLNVKRLAKTLHLFRSHRTSKFSTFSVLIFLCTFYLIRLPQKVKSCFIVFKQVTHTRPDILSCLKQ